MNTSNLNFDELVDSVCLTIADTLKKKNHDYGDSFFNQMQRYGDIASLLRLEEKVDRFRTLMDKEAQVSESMDDTMLDTAGYAILTVIAHKRMNG